MATKLKTGHICPNKSANDRAKEFSKEFYEESGLLFCRTCETSIDHKRKSTITDHLESKKHKLRKEKKTVVLLVMNQQAVNHHYYQVVSGSPQLIVALPLLLLQGKQDILSQMTLFAQWLQQTFLSKKLTIRF